MAGQRQAARARGVRLAEQVELTGLRLTAAARLPAARERAERAELLVLPPDDCVFAVGDLTDAQAGLLRARARAGASPAALLAALGRDGAAPERLLVGRVGAGEGSRPLVWARRGVEAPVMLSPDREHPQPAEQGCAEHPQARTGEVHLGPEDLLVVLSSPLSRTRSPEELLRAVRSGEDDDELCSRLLADLGAPREPGVVLALRGSAVHDGVHDGVLEGAPEQRVPGEEQPDPVDGLAELHDPGTGLPGSALALDRLHQAARALDRLSCGVVLLGVALPARSGPAALRRAASRLARAVRPGDTAARWRGDALLAICPSVDDLAAADALARRARAAVQAAVPGARLAALVLWDAPAEPELDLLPDRVAWLARRSGEAQPVLELSTS